MKIYTGSARSARCYLEQSRDRGRVDDYYLTEGTGIARRYGVDGDGRVVELASLTGDGYEAWVAGVDPETGQPKGRLRHDDRAVRFVEVVVNGPKSWSLAAELHPDIATAYEAAQDRAAGQIIGWLGQHATVRVGARGQQVQIPVERLEAVIIRHYTSRAGDPHRHLHLQLNARVFAAGQWRGLHTVGIRDSLGAINGIGHAAVVTDPAFRAALAAHGFTLDDAGEITQLAPFVGAFSRRAAQIAANLDRYEHDWATAHPGERPGTALRRAWDARAWADARPDKITPEPGADLNARWLRELAELGHVDRDKPLDLVPGQVGQLDRDRAVTVVLARLGAARSGWNAADIRGEVEQLLAREGIVADAGGRGELAEDLTARTLQRCIPLLHRDRIPEHIRALTSPPVLAVEDDIIRRLAVRGTEPGHDATTDLLTRAADLLTRAAAVAGGGRCLDAGQTRAVTVLAGDCPLVVVEGAAGAGKTTTLAATRAALALQGHALIVVTPTLKAAQAARAEVGAHAGSAAWLAHQHGWRWDQHGTWTRLAMGALDPVTGRAYRGPHSKAILRAGDLVLVDEAGMLDQDTARALLTLADQHHARVAFVGDRHQLPAVGRGGVLDLAHRWADPNARVSLDVVHRFTRQITDQHGRTRIVPDSEYAALSAAMRTGADPGAVFDTLHTRGQIRIHPSAVEQQQAIAADVLAARQAETPVCVTADTCDQATQLNAAIRQRLIVAGLVDDDHVATTRAGDRIGVGDLVATRRNDRGLDVANRDTWTVTGIDPTGGVWVSRGDTRNSRGDRAAHPDRLLPANYADRHVELAYASTVHGAQGDTTTKAHLVVGEQTGAASAYVGMTRGRHTNTAHLVADNVEQAREQWLATFARDRADLGPGHARQLAVAEASRYAQPRPLPQVLAELHDVWENQASCLEWLDHGVPVRDQLAEIVTLRREQPTQLAAAEQRYEQAKQAAERAKAAAGRSETLIAAQTSRSHDGLAARWEAQLPAARAHARTVLAGPGRLGLKLVAVNRAADQLAAWSMTWQPILPSMPTSTRNIAHYANGYLHQPQLHAAFERYARGQAEQAHPEHPGLLHTAEAAGRERDQAWQVLDDTHATQRHQLNYYGQLAHIEDPDQRLEQLDRDITSTQQQLTDAHRLIGRLAAEPAIAARPAEFLTTEHQTWRTDRDAERAAAQRAADLRLELAEIAAVRQRGRHPTIHTPHRPPAPDRGRSIGR